LDYHFQNRTGGNDIHLIFTIRSPRIFAVTTTTSLSTFNTQTLCYSQSDPTVPLTVCAARRKRMISTRHSNIDDENDGTDGEINPSNTEEEDYDYGLESSLQDEVIMRNGKFINYWITKTLTSTTTSYSATGTLGGIQCTPLGFTNFQCPNNGGKEIVCNLDLYDYDYDLYYDLCL